MTPVIAPARSPHYVAAMPRRFMRFLFLVAVLLMPFGTAVAPAAAHSAAAAEDGHCTDHQKPAEEPAKADAHCTACSALPAMEDPAPAAALVPATQRLIARAHRISGTEPEIATPPPKLA